MQGRREVLAVGLVWLAWLGAILLTVTIGLASGAYTFAQGWSIHHGLWPLFAWDYNWYHFVAYGGYPAAQGGRQYAFFPLWPELLRWSGEIPDVVAAAALAWAGSAAAFFGLAEGPPRARLRMSLQAWNSPRKQGGIPWRAPTPKAGASSDARWIARFRGGVT